MSEIPFLCLVPAFIFPDLFIDCDGAAKHVMSSVKHVKNWKIFIDTNIWLSVPALYWHGRSDDRILYSHYLTIESAQLNQTEMELTFIRLVCRFLIATNQNNGPGPAFEETWIKFSRARRPLSLWSWIKIICYEVLLNQLMDKTTKIT